MNTDMVIVQMSSITTYDFLRDGETAAEAAERGNRYYKENLEEIKGILAKYDTEYWRGRVEAAEKEAAAGCQVMSFDDFLALQKKQLITGELTEVTEEKFNEMLDILPPLHWVTINGVEMFCMSEMYTMTYTTQYAHIKGTDKYYCAMVDARDKSTWIHNILKGQGN